MSAEAPKVKKVKAPAAHPKYSVMIAAAITALKDRSGSSRQAILKYICANYKVDAAKAADQIRSTLKHGVAKGSSAFMTDDEIAERDKQRVNNQIRRGAQRHHSGEPSRRVGKD